MDPTRELLESLLRLTEVGRVLSAKNVAAIKATIQALTAMIASAGGTEDEQPDAAEVKKATEAAVALIEAELSHSDTSNALRLALRAASPGSKRWYWPRDVFDTYFVYEDSGPEDTGPSRLFKRTYVIADDGKVTFGDPVEVRLKTVYEPVGTPATESADLDVNGDFIPLVEKAVRRDSTVPVKLIQPGWGSSGYYGAEMLERDGPKVFTKGLKMFWDHPTSAQEAERPEGSLKDLAAELTSDARWVAEGESGPGLYADAKVFAPYKESIDELAPHIGVSIRALGRGKEGTVEGRKGKVIESLVGAKSVDFVTIPGAGGQVLQLFESARGRAHPTQPTREEGREVTEAEAQALREANTAAVTRLAVLEARALKAEAATFAAGQLETLAEAARLPQAARQRVLVNVLTDVPSKDGELDRETLTTRIKESVATEAAYVASIAGSGSIRGMGSAATTEQTQEQVSESLSESFVRLGLSKESAVLAAGGR